MIERIAFQPEHLLSLPVGAEVALYRQTAPLRLWAEMHRRAGPCVSIVADGEVMACGGIGLAWPGVAEAWMTLSPEGAQKPHVLLEIRKQVREWIETYHLWRLQASAMCAWPKAARFLEWLGMQKEGVLRRMAPDGADMVLYAWVKNG
jgi:hypothetical protein